VTERGRTVRVVTLLATVVLFVWTVGPLSWMLVVSVLPPVKLISQPPDFSGFSFDRYIQLLTDPSYFGALGNSAIVATATTAVCLVIGSLAGYALARLPVGGRNIVLAAILGTQMIPGIVLLIPVFLVMRNIGLIDSVFALITVYTAFLLPYSIWLLRNFFMQVPLSLEAAARMDGCTRLGVLFRIVLPVSAPGIAATGIFLFISSWNEFLFALLLTVQHAKTATVRLAEVQGEIFGQQDFAILSTAAVITVGPVVLAVIFLNRYVVRGLVEGAVKA
jgi:ABC-type glycerol-3-phosphate transport system permease component